MQMPTVRAAAVILRGSEVLLQRRKSEHLWALPGGRVKFGECASEALVREFLEELGASLICGPVVWLVENFFVHGGIERHEVGLYFSGSLNPSSSALAHRFAFSGSEASQPLEFAWVERSALAGILLRPSFLAGALAKPVLEFVHVVLRSQEAL
jgi:ADP-ribose pyrophosphatase YjhB (NUDIX family)